MRTRRAAIDEIKNRLEGGLLHALVNNAAISPKAEGGKRLTSVDTTVDVWEHVFASISSRRSCWRAD